MLQTDDRGQQVRTEICTQAPLNRKRGQCRRRIVLQIKQSRVTETENLEEKAGTVTETDDPEQHAGTE